MAKIKIEFDCDNAAFEGENRSHEIAAILAALALKISNYQKPESLHDSNGNRVGSVKYMGKVWK